MKENNMTQYINKVALVAEIERRIKSANNDVEIGAIESLTVSKTLNSLLSFIDTLEVKEFKVEPKFKVGDWIGRDNGLIIGRVISFDGEYYHYISPDGVEQPIHVSNISSYHLWTIEDAKDGDVLVAKIYKEPNDFIYIFKEYNQNLGFLSHCYLDAYINKFHEGIYHNNYNVGVPATKEQRDLLFSKMKEAGYEWDAEKKELKKIEQKPAWSEEDDRMLDRLIKHFDWGSGYYFNENGYDAAQAWLKSIKERVQSQPKQELSNDAATNEYINLGLPSGTLWKTFNEDGYYKFDEAIEKFGDNLPSKEQWNELKDNCNWAWNGAGYEVTGPNGNTIFLPANGYRIATALDGVGMCGGYWSNTYSGVGSAYSTYISEGDIRVYYNYRDCGLSIRLAK